MPAIVADAAHDRHPPQTGVHRWDTLIVSCRLHKVDPMAYITDVLRRVSSHPASRVRELTPMAWAAAYKTSLQKTEESK